MVGSHVQCNPTIENQYLLYYHPPKAAKTFLNAGNMPRSLTIS